MPHPLCHCRMHSGIPEPPPLRFDRWQWLWMPATGAGMTHESNEADTPRARATQAHHGLASPSGRDIQRMMAITGGSHAMPAAM